MEQEKMERKQIKVVAGIIRKGDMIFATQRGYGNYKDWWEFPGGKLEPGETPAEALVRELLEELDITVAVDRFLTTVEYDYPEFHLSMDCFWCHIKDGELTLLEHEAAKWLPCDDLWQVKWLPADVLVIQEIERWIRIRGLRSDETDLLKEFLYEAIFIPEGVDPPKKEIINEPELRIYYEDFGSRPADHCLVAEADGRVVGAVWTRIMDDYGHVDDETPSFAISLYKDYRGQGIGTRLMKKMLALLKECGYRKASLAVQKKNDAVRMYKNVGFKIIDENAEEYIMVCELTDPLGF